MGGAISAARDWGSLLREQKLHLQMNSRDKSHNFSRLSRSHCGFCQPATFLFAFHTISCIEDATPPHCVEEFRSFTILFPSPPPPSSSSSSLKINSSMNFFSNTGEFQKSSITISFLNHYFFFLPVSSRCFEKNIIEIRNRINCTNFSLPISIVRLFSFNASIRINRRVICFFSFFCLFRHVYLGNSRTLGRETSIS